MSAKKLMTSSLKSFFSHCNPMLSLNECHVKLKFTKATNGYKLMLLIFRLHCPA